MTDSHIRTNRHGYTGLTWREVGDEEGWGFMAAESALERASDADERREDTAMWDDAHGEAQGDQAAQATMAAVARLNDALNRHDVDAVMAAMTDDCIFDNTYPPPDGERFEGQESVRAFWENLLRSSPSTHFEAEEIFAAGDRCVVRWRYTYDGPNGQTEHIRGVDVLRVRDGRVAEKLAYVKG
jgi:ketosteroid isomerase-like protein